MPTERLIKVYSTDGTLLAEESAKSNAKRFSVRAHADQRQLDGLIAKHPTSVRATIADLAFTVDADRLSQFIGRI